MGVPVFPPHYILLDNWDLVVEVAEQRVTTSDITALGYRKEQIKIFEGLLSDIHFFEEKKYEWQRPNDEAVWQWFFEKNPWIFGYGLNYIFYSPLDDKKLEQVTTGWNFNQSEKRPDALLKTRGLVSSLCFVEIKTHRTPLIKKEFRPDSWSISDDLAGSIAQIQKTLQKAARDIHTKTDITIQGDPTGEAVFLYQPKAYVVIGNLGEFISTYGINEEKYSSFEIFRRSITNPEIITFDELFERAKFVTYHSSETLHTGYDRDTDTEDIPF